MEIYSFKNLIASTLPLVIQSISDERDKERVYIDTLNKLYEGPLTESKTVKDIEFPDGLIEKFVEAVKNYK